MFRIKIFNRLFLQPSSPEIIGDVNYVIPDGPHPGIYSRSPQEARYYDYYHCYYYQRPPGDIEETRNRIYTFKRASPYPPKSPVVPLFCTSARDDEWREVVQTVPIFQSQPGNLAETEQRKSDHLQFYFWTALDRSNRYWENRHVQYDGMESQGLWHSEDMRGTQPEMASGDSPY
ncbi:hypothetical protein FSPOR_1852 [Fusarium sporotrichioides]|uniref:Uncharacterized protein n=1 Tax=Fusarium sporotrichioides TaxID=5514 RepID=A0A395SPR7_FUSSP|nr:hypothetical protein FSPOR_1852 [Fusarium sporotrichioides]